MSAIDPDRVVYIIVHGQRQLLDRVKDKLTSKGFNREKMQMASLEKAGSAGEYVAMIWPPMAPKEIVISKITGTNGEGSGVGISIGAWSSISQKELDRISL